MLAPYSHRIAALQQTLVPSQVAILSKPADIQYFSGFQTLVPQEREAFLALTVQDATLFHASFSPVTHWDCLQYQATTSIAAILEKIVAWKDLERLQPDAATGRINLLLDYTSLFVSEFTAFKQKPELLCNPLNLEKIWNLRMIKDATEQEALKQAALLSTQTLAHIWPLLQPGKTEQELAWEIEKFIKQTGGELAFPTIVAFGAHAALPHHQPTGEQLASESVVLLDFGAKVAGYCSDMTRTIWVGKQPSPIFCSVEQAVKTAYSAGLAVCEEFASSCTPEFQQGTATPLRAVDIAARSSLEKAGYGKQFIHTTGHGLGLEIHEQPSIYKTTPRLMQLGMAFTIEPGVYLPGQFGYRYENTILLLQEKVVELTR
jgi:Xaa-Pro aminopeptidase